MRTVLAAIGVLCVLGGAARAQSTSRPPETQKQKDIRKLLKITGSGELGTQVMGQMIGNMKKAMPQVPEKFWADFMKEVHTDELVDMIVPVYDRNLTQDDVTELIHFYEITDRQEVRVGIAEDHAGVDGRRREVGPRPGDEGDGEAAGAAVPVAVEVSGASRSSRRA